MMQVATGICLHSHDQERLEGTSHRQQISEGLVTQEKQDTGIEDKPQESKDNDSAPSSSLLEPVNQLLCWASWAQSIVVATRWSQ